MKQIFAAILLTSTCLSPIIAADIDFSSNVNSVTVYPRGAEVTRMASGAIPAGDHVIIVDDLPGSLVANSLRVKGSSAQPIAIGSVDIRQTHISKSDHSEERLKIEQEIEALKDKILALGQEINNANMQRTMLQGMAGRAILPRGEKGGAVVISASELTELLSTTGTMLEQISATTQKARISQRKLQRQIQELQHQLTRLSPKQELRSIVSINLTAKADAKAKFTIIYNVDEAGWTPVYDAKLALGDKGKDSKVTLVRRASVQQATTDKWENISLKLSTARPRGNTQVSQLSPYELREISTYEKRTKKRNRRLIGRIAPSAESARDEVMAAAPAPVKKIRRKRVVVEYAGFLAEYKIPGHVSISNAGAEKNVTIGEEDFDAEISANAVPKIDPAAYLTAKFILKGAAPYLPGTVMLSRDGIFLGRARLPLLNPGEQHTLGFGRDDFIKVKRTQVTKKKSESGFISTSNVEERKFVTSINNLHDFPMRVTIQDQLPYATHEDIVVEVLADSTKPSERNVGKKRGILAWSNMLNPKATKTINFGYKVSWPKKMAITPVR